MANPAVDASRIDCFFNYGVGVSVGAGVGVDVSTGVGVGVFVKSPGFGE